MNKTILITGATDGIGLKTAELLASLGHKILIHGRNKQKILDAKRNILENIPKADIKVFYADFSSLIQVKEMAESIKDECKHIDVLINNAGVFGASETITNDKLELRFQVNTIAPYLLTKLLLPILNDSSRIVNLSSAAQSRVDIKSLIHGTIMEANDAYAQSKLALTMWSMQMGRDFLKKGCGPSIIAVNPKSFLGSKMVKEAYRTEGYDLGIGADILSRASLSIEFSNVSAQYYDNDIESFSSPHNDALDELKCKDVIYNIEQVLLNLNIEYISN